MTGSVVEACGVSKTFPMPAGPVTALRGVTLEIRLGEHVAIMGPSGCGKFTLLHVVGCVEPPTGGQLWFGGQDVSDLSDAERSRIRLQRVGFVFQWFFLLPMLTARENIQLPMGECGLGKRARGRWRIVPRWCSPTSRPGSSTRRRGGRWPTCWTGCTRTGTPWSS